MLDWQKRQAAECSCKGSDEYCPCQNVDMSDPEYLRSQIVEAEARVERLRQVMRAGPCREFGHDWKHIGGRNAGCGDGCCCSVPVHVCQKCGDSDYGDNPEAAETIASCAADSTS